MTHSRWAFAGTPGLSVTSSEVAKRSGCRRDFTAAIAHFLFLFGIITGLAQALLVMPQLYTRSVNLHMARIPVAELRETMLWARGEALGLGQPGPPGLSLYISILVQRPEAPGGCLSLMPAGRDTSPLHKSLHPETPQCLLARKAKRLGGGSHGRPIGCAGLQVWMRPIRECSACSVCSLDSREQTEQPRPWHRQALARLLFSNR